uniref:Uncharacterized protein n=1 Tax=Avena sativa TaxID=4498 RepID=A0ACD5T959_AVESA
MRTPLLNRKRGRGPARSTRYSVRRAGGGMAWTGSGTDRFLRRQRAGEDRISTLPDDLLLAVMRRLDTRTALGTGILSSRWASLPRELPALDFRVGDILPPRYHTWIRLHRDRGTHVLYTEKKHIVPNIRRYERRAMRSLASSIQSILDAPADDERRVNRLRLDFFITTYSSGCCMNRLIAKAVDAWGVDDLEAVAKPTFCQWGQAHTFPSHGMCKEPRTSRLRRLKLGGCVIPQLHEYSALTILVLQDLPESTPTAAYEAVFTSCQQLQVLHLNSCGCGGDKIIVVDAPASEIRELVVDHCAFHRFRLRALPCLESIASLQTRVFFQPSSCPSFRKWNFALRLGITHEGLRQCFKDYLDLELDQLFQRTPDITNMVIRFTRPDRWFVPLSSPSLLLPNLRRLLVADVPSSWDVSWPRRLLEMAPSLEILHIHIAPCAEEPCDELCWQPTKLRQHHLKEFVMAGFEGTDMEIYLVKFVMGVCTALSRVILSKNGYARDKGHWDWEMVTHQYSWSDEEKDTMLKQIMDGVSSSTAPVHLV